MKIPLSSISYKQYKQLIESGQNLNLKFVVNFVGIGVSLLVTGPGNCVVLIEMRVAEIQIKLVCRKLGEVLFAADRQCFTTVCDFQ